MNRLLRRPEFWIVILVLFTHRLAFGADFSKDDLGVVVDNDATSPASWHFVLLGKTWGDVSAGSQAVGLFQILPQLAHGLSGSLFGASPAAYHFWNVFAHLAVCLVVYRLIRELLSHTGLLSSQISRDRAALAGTVLLACHPLASGTVCSAHDLGVQFMTLFTAATILGVLRLRAHPTWGRTAWTSLTMTLAMLSAPLGAALVVACIVVLALALRGQGYRKLPRASFWLRPVVVVTLLLALGISLYALIIWKEALAMTYGSGADWSSQWLTQGRVFWDYARLLVAPTSLSDGYEIPWSTSWGDTTAVVGLSLALGLVAILLLLLGSRHPRRRVAPLLGLLAAAPLLLGWLMPHSQAFDESRAYAVLPWIAALFGIGFGWLVSRWQAIRWPLAIGAVGACIVLTWRHAAAWESAELLAEDTVQKQPLELGSLAFSLQKRFERDEFASVIGARFAVERAYEKMIRFNSDNTLHRAYNLENAFRQRVECERLITLALAENYGSHYALAYADHILDELARDAEILAAHDPRARVLLSLPMKLVRDLIAANAVALDRRHMHTYSFLRAADAVEAMLRSRVLLTRV